VRLLGCFGSLHAKHTPLSSLTLTPHSHSHSHSPLTRSGAAGLPKLAGRRRGVCVCVWGGGDPTPGSHPTSTQTDPFTSTTCA
jgi:hypothetical protein